MILTSDLFPDGLQNSTVFVLMRASVFGIINIYAVKMAAVFMFSTSTIVIYARFAPYWLASLGYALAAVLLFGGGLFGWGLIVLPVWVFAVSMCLLIDDRGQDTVHPS
jgi:hypothetical protein